MVGVMVPLHRLVLQVCVTDRVFVPLRCSRGGWLMLHLAFWLRLHVILFERACTWTFLVDRNDVYLHHHLFCFMYQCSGWYVRVYVYQACIDMIIATRLCQQASCHGGPELRSGMFFWFSTQVHRQCRHLCDPGMWLDVMSVWHRWTRAWKIFCLF